MSELHDECGVFGIWSPVAAPVARMTYYGLTALQHRGQEAAGIAVNRDRVIHFHKELGLVHEVFSEDELNKLGEGEMAVGHVRYSTSGQSNVNNAQPMVIKHVKGQLAIVHNGNLVNSYELRHNLEMKGCIFHTSSDTEVISYIITGERLRVGSIEKAVSEAMYKIDGAYSLIIMSPAKLIAARDPMGFKPLCMGKKKDGTIVFASESCALNAVGAAFVRDLLPGEIIMVDKYGELHINREHCGTRPRKSCIFEYIYFARPDSVIDGVSCHDYRVRAGHELAKLAPVDADIVIGVPDSGLDAAVGYSEESGIPYGIGLIKNKYIGRTFIAPTQAERELLVNLKLNAISSAISGKRVVLIDDSIVRGTTSARIVRQIRAAGAREVHMRISSPTFLNPCYYGTDVDSKENLIAVKHSVEEIAEIIEADSLQFLPVETAVQMAGWDKTKYHECPYCAACFDGKYPTRIPSVTEKERFDVS